MKKKSWTFLVIFSAILMTSCMGLDAGWRAQRSGNYDEAKKQAIVALAKDPKNPDVYRLIASTALSQGEYDRALKSAQFASSLDGGSLKSEQLVREAAYAKKDWKTLCEGSLRIIKRGDKLEPEDESRLADAYEALSKSFSGDGYGCGIGLESFGRKVEHFDTVKAKYADAIARNGRVTEALEIEEKLDDPRVSQLNVSKRLFALRRMEEGTAKLKAYATDPKISQSEREKRLSEVALVCEEYRQYSLEAELLSLSESPDNEIPLGIALRRNFDQEASDKVFEKHFSRKDRNINSVLLDSKFLIDSGYPNLAAKNIETCDNCINDIDSTFEASELLTEYGQTEVANELLNRLGEKNSTDAELQKRLFEWFRSHGNNRLALKFGESAESLGVKDDNFYGELLETYVDVKEINTYVTKSTEWLNSDKSKSLMRRDVLAHIEYKRKRWSEVIEMVKPMDESDNIGGAFDIYMQSYLNLKEYEKAYEVLNKYYTDNDMYPVQKAQYFLNSAAEEQYRKCLNPLLTGDDQQKYKGELELARYYLIYKGSEEEGKEAATRALNALNKSALAYQGVVDFLTDNAGIPTTISFAEDWHKAYPSDENAYSTLTRLYFFNRDYESASKLLDEYVSGQANKAQAIMYGFDKFTQFQEYDLGFEWLEKHVTPVLDKRFDLEYFSVLAEARYQLYSRLRSYMDPHASMLRQQSIEDYRTLLKSNPSKAMSYGSKLYMLEDWEYAAQAFNTANANGQKWDAGSRKMWLKAALRASQPSETIKGIVSGAKDANEIFAITDLLVSEQHPEYSTPALESLFKDESVDTRIKAYEYLIQGIQSEGDDSKLNIYNQKLEQSGPENPDIRMRLVKTALSFKQWDDAVRHLMWLQAQRPDSREVMIDELILARRAPKHAGAQSLLETTLESANGVYHRLDWISQYYASVAEYDKALVYAEKAHALTKIKDYELEKKLLNLYMVTGLYQSSKREEASQLLASLQSSSLWNSDNLRDISAVAHQASYETDADAWMRTAIELSPMNTNFKRNRLEMALDAEDEGQISISLENAIDKPIAEVLEPLSERHHIFDIMDAIDKFKAAGEYTMALSALLKILPEYIQIKGPTATRHELTELSELEPDMQTSASKILALHDLLGNDPCHAMDQKERLEDPSVWARLTLRCPEANDSIYSTLRTMRSAFPKDKRQWFDQTYIDTLISMRQNKLAGLYAENMGISVTSYENFENLLSQGSSLEALKSLELFPVSSNEMIQVMRTLSDYGYTKEALEYIHTNWDKIPDSMQPQVAGIALMLGDSSEKYIKLISSNKSEHFDTLDNASIEHIVTIDVLKQWLSNTPTQNMNKVIGLALVKASQNAAPKDEILQLIRQEIDRRSGKATLRINAAQYALRAGLLEFALEMIEKSEHSYPTSDLIYRLKSMIFADMHQDDKAIQSLDEGALYVPTVSLYWDVVAIAHEHSSLPIRQHINQVRRKMEPRNIELMVESVGLSLEAGDFESARQTAETALSYGSTGVATKLVNVYDSTHMLSRIPPQLAAGTSSQNYELEARIAIAQKQPEVATQKYIDAASRSAWPIDVYVRGIELMLTHQFYAEAEQLIAKLEKDWPHAYMSDCYRAVFDLINHQPDKAWQDYETAKSKSMDTNPWTARIALAALQQQDLNFAKRLYESEIKSGTIQASVWIKTIVSHYLDEDSALKAKQSSSEYAVKGLDYIEQLLPNAVYVIRQDDSLLKDIHILAKRANRLDWIQRLGVVSF